MLEPPSFIKEYLLHYADVIIFIVAVAVLIWVVNVVLHREDDDIGKPK